MGDVWTKSISDLHVTKNTRIVTVKLEAIQSFTVPVESVLIVILSVRALLVPNPSTVLVGRRLRTGSSCPPENVDVGTHHPKLQKLQAPNLIDESLGV